MLSKKRKLIIISSIIILSFTVMGFVYALLSDNMNLTNKIRIGSLKIEDIDLQLINSKNEEVNTILPGDINTIKWTTKNVGTSAALTRHTLEIYWDEENEELNDINKKMIYIFPANLKEEVILEDYEKGEQSTYMIKTESISSENDGKIKKGIKYQFVGDTLNGTDNKNVSKEVNYNFLDGAETVTDTNIMTDDSDATKDEISFRLLMNPKTSYLYQGMNVSIKVTTEAMQYTEDGNQNWTVIDTVVIN